MQSRRVVLIGLATGCSWPAFPEDKVRAEMNVESLVYVGDPLCIYCVSFGATLRATKTTPRLVMGGLRPRERRQPWSPGFQVFVRPHWRRVEALLGERFHHSLFDGSSALDRDGFFDTELVDRGVVAVRSIEPALALPMFEALGRAFYIEGRDVHAPRTIVEVGRRLGVDADRLERVLISELNERETWSDFALARAMGVQGFPTVLRTKGDRAWVVSHGYLPPDEFLAQLSAQDVHPGARP